MTNNDSPNRRISKFSIIGAIILPFGFFFVFLFIPVSTSTSATSATLWQNVLRFTLLPVSIIAPFASTALGLLGISEIRKSDGRIYGLPLAVFVSLFYPIILLDVLLFIVGWSLLGDIQVSSIIPLAWLTMVLVIDYIIVRLTWRAATRNI